MLVLLVNMGSLRPNAYLLRSGFLWIILFADLIQCAIIVQYPSPMLFKANMKALGPAVSPITFRNDYARDLILKNATSQGMKAANQLVNVQELRLYNKGIKLSEDSPAKFAAIFAKSRPAAKNLSTYAHASLYATEIFSKVMSLEKEQIEEHVTNVDISGTDLLNICPVKYIEPIDRHCPPEVSYMFRKPDGTCNNLLNPDYGQAMQPFNRFLPPDYGDGIQEARRSSNPKSKLPSPRRISLMFTEQKSNPSKNASLMLMVWGQFVDHDLTHTALSIGFNGSKIKCCGIHFNDRHPECLPIRISQSDPYYAQFGIRCMEFVRSSPVPKTNCLLGPREQINQITSFLDASNVYGSSQKEMNDLRFLQKGRLVSTHKKNRRELLPAINKHIGADECRNHTETLFCFRAGDARCNEQPSLTALHTIWQREHNRLALELTKLNPHWVDERIFQEARKIVGAVMQHITYNEWLPVVLGKEIMRIYNLSVTKQGFADRDNYDVSLKPTISNVFATAAFRFGHSLVQDSIKRYSKMHQKLQNDIPLHKELFNPISLHMFGSLDRIMLGVANEPSQSVDNFVSPELVNHLFQNESTGHGMDLFSMNIQRGREHGIPALNKWRQVCGLRVLESFQDLYSIMAPDLALKIQQIYDNVNDIDLFVGGLAEAPLPGSMIGPTFSCIIAQQFLHLKKGDRFWFENQGLPSSFTLDQLSEIKKASLSRVICDNSDDIMSVQLRIFETVNERNRRVSCRGGQLRKIELRPWQESSYSWNR